MKEKNKKVVQPTDVCVGKNIRFYRIHRGLSCRQVAHAIGITQQQLYKYEIGQNRVAISRLCEISGVLDVPFMEFLPTENKTSQKQIDPNNINLLRKVTRSLGQITDKEQLKAVLGVIELFSKEQMELCLK